MHPKRGVSTVIVTLIMIALAMVAIGIVWGVVSNILKSGEEDVSTGLGQIFLNLKIEKANIESNGDIKVTVKRGEGGGEIAGINFVVSDGTNSQILREDTTLQELGTQTFTISQSKLTGVAFVKEVSIAPITKSGTKERIGDVVDKKEFTTKQILQGLDAISWWGFESDAKDIIGETQGEIKGDTDCNVEGKKGKGCEFFGDGNGVEDYIEFSSPTQYDIPWTACSWVYLKENLDTRAHIFLDDSDLTVNHYSLRFSMHNNKQAGFTSYIVADYYFNYEFPVNEWKFACYLGDSAGTHLYVDGQLIESNPNIIKLPLKYVGHSPLRSSPGDASSHAFIGIIDELTIFNKALTMEEINSLYKL